MIWCPWFYIKFFVTPFSFAKLSPNHVNISFHLLASLVHFLFLFSELIQQFKIRVFNTRHRIRHLDIKYRRWYSQLMLYFNLVIWFLSYENRWTTWSWRTFMPQKNNNWKQQRVCKTAFYFKSMWILWVSKYWLNRGERNNV